MGGIATTIWKLVWKRRTNRIRTGCSHRWFFISIVCNHALRVVSEGQAANTADCLFRIPYVFRKTGDRNIAIIQSERRALFNSAMDFLTLTLFFFRPSSSTKEKCKTKRINPKSGVTKGKNESLKIKLARNAGSGAHNFYRKDVSITIHVQLNRG